MMVAPSTNPEKSFTCALYSKGIIATANNYEFDVLVEARKIQNFIKNYEKNEGIEEKI